MTAHQVSEVNRTATKQSPFYKWIVRQPQEYITLLIKKKMLLPDTLASPPQDFNSYVITNEEFLKQGRTIVLVLLYLIQFIFL